jgi:hypothetical protein
MKMSNGTADDRGGDARRFKIPFHCAPDVISATVGSVNRVRWPQARLADAWLGGKRVSTANGKPRTPKTVYAVSSRVTNSRNEGAELIAPV